MQVSFKSGGVDAPGVTIEAEIMRRITQGIGVQLIEVNEEQRQALRAIAASAVEERIPAGSASDAGTNRDSSIHARRIMRLCLKNIERQLPNIIFALRTEVVSKLRLLRDGKSQQEIEEIDSDADALEQKATAIGRTIERRVLLGFAEVGGLENTQELFMASASAEQQPVTRAQAPVDMVGHDVAEQSAALLGAINRVESTLKGKSFDLNLRLADVVQHRTDTEDNPLVPAVMCRILWEAVTEQKNSRNVKRCLTEVIARRIVPLLRELYDDIDATLDKQGVPKAFGLQ